MQKITNKAFTLIELVMVILLLAILAAIAIPNFIDFRTDAKNGATQGALGALRAAMAVATAAIQLREDPTIPTPKYPTWLEASQGAFDASHPVLNTTSIMDQANGTPKNPWSLSTMLNAFHSTVIDCLSGALSNSKSNVNSATGFDYRGWCYRQTSGEIWANSNLNGGSANKTENAF